MAHNNGSFYVPIEKPQSAVIKAINNSQGHQVILLYGGAGEGKSTLAKWIYYKYGEARENGNREDRGNENPFERLPILVPCAKCSKDDISAKQFQILQEHSPDFLGDLKPKEKGSPDSRIAEALRDFLSVKKVLIVLDDVTNIEFLHGMWASTSGDGRDVKYLVTSQDANICDMLGEPERIAMEKPTPDEARKILGSLVGLGPIIPTELQPTANKIIQAVELNPLALACVASQFKHTVNKEEMRIWSEAYKGLDKILKSKDEKLVLGSTPRSLGAAIESCINNLDSPDARKILFLMYACKAEVVPEAILRILHASIGVSSCTFFTLKDELVVKELLKPAVNPTQQDQNDGEARAWSLGSLAKLFIKHWVDEKGKRYEKDVRSMIGELVGESVGDEELATKSTVKQCKQACEAERRQISEEARVTIVLCALYFDRSHVDMYQIVIQAMTRANIPYSNGNFNDLRRQAIEPMVWLLDKEEEEEGESWKGQDVCCVRKVILAYLCDGQLDGNNIAHLLKLKACPAAQLTTLKAIRDICYTEEKPLFSENNLNFLQTILHLMDSNVGLPAMSIQKAASRTLRAICSNAAGDPSSSLVGDAPGVLDIFVRALASPTHWSAEDAGCALWALAYEFPANRLKIIDKQGALVGLVKCLFEDNKPDLQEIAAGALANLTASKDDSIRSRIIFQDQALEGLVKCLFKRNETNLQEYATLALMNLTASKDHGILKSRIINQDDALDGLVKCLSVHDKPKVQELALASLANLAKSTEQMRIAKQKGVLAGIQKFLVAQGHPKVQARAAQCLWNLSECEKARAVLKGTGGLAKGLSSLLVDGIPPTTQYHGARALTMIDPTLGKEASLTSADAYSGRAAAFAFVGMYVEALADLDQLYVLSVDLQQRASQSANLSRRCFVRAKLKDFKGALDDANEAVKVSDSDKFFALQERGVLKQIMGDLEGALADLDEGLKLETDDYERLKHRGYVKFLLKDKEGARADAEWALRIKPPSVDRPMYGRNWLGTTSVEYLGYKLKWLGSVSEVVNFVAQPSLDIVADGG